MTLRRQRQLPPSPPAVSGARPCSSGAAERWWCRERGTGPFLARGFGRGWRLRSAAALPGPSGTGSVLGGYAGRPPRVLLGGRWRPASPRVCRGTAVCLGQVATGVRLHRALQGMSECLAWRLESLVLKLCCRGSKDVNFCPGNILGFVGELYLLSANARLRLWAIMQLALCSYLIFFYISAEGILSVEIIQVRFQGRFQLAEEIALETFETLTFLPI